MGASRREFLTGVGGTIVGAAAISACGERDAPAVATSPADAVAPPPTPKPPKNKAPDLGVVPLQMKGPIPRRPLGNTGVDVSLLCLGGHHLGTIAEEREAVSLVHEALEHGLDFFDCAWEYHDGRSEELLGKALVGRRDQAFVMTKVCTHGRDAKAAMQMLEDSLRRLQSDVIDLWQVHEVIYDDDPDRHYASDGVLAALERAKKDGKVRFVGFTGHKDPRIHLDMLERGFAFDACQLPLNCFDGTGFRSFERQVLPVLGKRGIAALGMKSMGGGGEPVKNGIVTAAEALGYTMSLPVASVVTGIDSVAVLHQNLNLAGGFRALGEAELQGLRDRVGPVAADGRFELFKTSKKYDCKPGRQQHGFPPPDELSD